MDILSYYQCERVHPTTMHHALRHSNKEAELLSKRGDLLWALVHNQLPLEGEQQNFAGWKGFYLEVTKDENKPIHDIHYLPAINQSPTKFDTVQEILVQVKAKPSALCLSATDLVLDHAIYMKALEVFHNRRNAKLRDFINLRIGGFHACNVFLAVIGKRFGSAGLRDLIEEAHIAGPNQAKGILKGKHYNNGIRISKIVFEALLRLKFECFQKW